eukprot:CAMPEP_0196639218 /NCGR_PEP_ID=MMETSP1085-20130531/1862_1 /TAXON_ID=41879 ORGANISM="Pycnococcus sp, Strain CCMP1998" /NCGR_SAMPLE_ID=MMETSP1085 /ASSEMBLY_ACC=CAM_ASM_000807 /LENGTH=46 /DNA_ID= /DNA_START= /DNA_END= /DNA_ORIENTATION=
MTFSTAPSPSCLSTSAPFFLPDAAAGLEGPTAWRCSTRRVWALRLP